MIAPRQAAAELLEAPEAWRALADPTRRAILDLLREGPKTTGDIADRFAMTRFGVMKHLEVLAVADLVMVRREGRKRWNQLNPMPIHQIYRRWIRPFETLAADRLTRLQRHAETAQEEAPMEVAQFRALDIQLAVEIAASPAVVWRSLTAGIGDWWPAKFYVGAAPKRFALECHVGGRVYEDWGDGEGALFGTVVVFQENSFLQWAGDMSAEYGGPARSVTSFRLKPGPEGRTILSFRDTPFGLLREDAIEGLEQGWRWLLSDCLKPFLELGRRPDRPSTLKE